MEINLFNFTYLLFGFIVLESKSIFNNLWYLITFVLKVSFGHCFNGIHQFDQEYELVRKLVKTDNKKIGLKLVITEKEPMQKINLN